MMDESSACYVILYECDRETHVKNVFSDASAAEKELQDFVEGLRWHYIPNAWSQHNPATDEFAWIIKSRYKETQEKQT